MYEIVWQYDEREPHEVIKPADAAEARRFLTEGNQRFSAFFTTESGSDTHRQIVRISPQGVGISLNPGEPPTQEPFAAFLSCADARVPVELIFGQQANDLFVVRVAGNVLGDECLGSLGYAVDQLGTVRLLAVLGHTGCGAVTTAVDAYLNPVGYLGVAANFPLQAIVSKLMAPVRGAAAALVIAHGDGVGNRPGYRQALIEAAVVLNTALSAAVLSHNFNDALGERLQVSFGIYDLRNRTVGLPDDGPGGDWRMGLFAPPTTQAGFDNFGLRIARSRLVTDILGL